MEKMDEIGAVLKRFGDEQSTLLDQYERLSFEVQLNRAILGRSLSEPSVRRIQAPPTPMAAPPPPPPPPLMKQVGQGKRRAAAGLQKALKKLLKPILGRKGRPKADHVPNPKDPRFWKTFSRSLRV